MPPKAWPFFIMLFLIFAAPGLFAQEEEEPSEPPPIDTEWFEFQTTVYVRGDRTFTIGLGTIFPTFFGGDIVDNNHNLFVVGGTGSLSFNYFLSPHVFVGAELGGMFSRTLARNMLFMIPFGGRIGYQFLLGRFEFPVSLMVGGVPTMYMEHRHFGLIVQPAAAVFWRFNQDWSFGLNTAWWFAPQWSRERREEGILVVPARTTFGNFAVLTLAARYHF